jgi:hypothetical protein
MVVIAIIGLAMAAVAVNLGALTPETRLTSAGRHIAAMITKARDEAAIGGFTIGIGYDLDHSLVWLSVPAEELDEGEEADPGERVRLQLERLHEDLEIVNLDLGSGNIRTSGETVVDFSPLGYTTAHIVQLRCRQTPELSLWLQVNPLTGEVLTTYSADDGFDQPPTLEEKLTDASFY